MLITIRQRNTYKNLFIDDVKATVSEIKEAIAKEMDIPANEQRLVLKGRILSDLSMVIRAEKMDNCAIHLVRIAKPQTTDNKTDATNLAKITKDGQTKPFMNPADIEEIPGVLNKLNEMMSSANGTEMATELFNNPGMLDTLEQAGNVARKYLSDNPTLMSEVFVNEKFQTAICDQMRELMNPVGEHKSDLQDFVKIFADSYNIDSEQLTAGIKEHGLATNSMTDFINEAGLLDKLPDLIGDALVGPAAQAPGSASNPAGDIVRELVTAPGLGLCLKQMIDSLADGTLLNQGGLTKSAELDDSSDSPCRDQDTELEVPCDIDEMHLDVLCDLGFVDREANIEVLRRHKNDVDGAIHELLNRK